MLLLGFSLGIDEITVFFGEKIIFSQLLRKGSSDLLDERDQLLCTGIVDFFSKPLQKEVNFVGTGEVEGPGLETRHGVYEDSGEIAVAAAFVLGERGY